MKITKTIVNIRKMDCPSEEMMIRQQLSDIAAIHSLRFDIPKRTLVVYHNADADAIIERINKLSLDAHFVADEQVDERDVQTGNEQVQRAALLILLGINGAMFVVELIAGLLYDSTGLLGDSLDMLADASVYLLALFAVGRSLAVKNRITFYSGLTQLILALTLIAAVIQKFLHGSEPLSLAMILVSAVALIANAYCLYLITPHRHGEKHMTASWIFTANDVLINIGVILAGILVSIVSSNIPDLLIGSIIAVIVAIGAIHILLLARPSCPTG